MMMAAPGAGAGAAAAAPAVEEKTTFDVVLEEIPADKKVRKSAFYRTWYSLSSIC